MRVMRGTALTMRLMTLALDGTERCHRWCQPWSPSALVPWQRCALADDARLMFSSFACCANSPNVETDCDLALQELGMPALPVGVRLNVGFERDESVVRKSFPPQADFECWGWMSKKGGVRRNWLERFFHLSAAGVLTYYENCNTVGVKKGGSTKMRLVGFKEKGSIDLKQCSEIRLGTAENKTPGELELVMEERTFRESRCKHLSQPSVTAH